MRLALLALLFVGCWTDSHPRPQPQSQTDDAAITPRKVVVKDLVQPVTLSNQDDSEPGGVEGGVAGGAWGGVQGGTQGPVQGGLGSPPPPPPPPPPPSSSTNVSPQLLEAQRIAGDRAITPDDAG